MRKPHTSTGFPLPGKATDEIAERIKVLEGKVKYHRDEASSRRWEADGEEEMAEAYQKLLDEWRAFQSAALASGQVDRSVAVKVKADSASLTKSPDYYLMCNSINGAPVGSTKD